MEAESGTQQRIDTLQAAFGKYDATGRMRVQNLFEEHVEELQNKLNRRRRL
jgi:hypothetical protein